MEVALSPELDQLVTDQVENGNYPSAGEVVRDALRLFRDQVELRRRRSESLRRDVEAGIEALERGDSFVYEADDTGRLAAEIKARGRERLRERGRVPPDG